MEIASQTLVHNTIFSLNLALEGILNVCFQLWVIDGISEELGQFSPILICGMVFVATKKDQKRMC